VILLNTELSRSKREEERLRRHVRQLEAELKILQRRNAASRGSRGGLDPPYRSNSSRPSSRLSSRPTSADVSRATSRLSSRAPSAAATSANASRTSSRPTSRPTSLPGSRERSAAPSRSSSAERSRPPSRDSRAPGGGRSSRERGVGAPSLGAAARQALQQTRRNGSQSSLAVKPRVSSPLAGPALSVVRAAPKGRVEGGRRAPSDVSWDSNSSDEAEASHHALPRERRSKQSGGGAEGKVSTRFGTAEDVRPLSAAASLSLRQDIDLRRTRLRRKMSTCTAQPHQEISLISMFPVIFKTLIGG
ncbi:MAG: hypothetical protein SGPRY_003277, partial [Prymnesium sp.]